MGLERLVFFSDAVFAIAITLLVIELRLPEGHEGRSVAERLGDMAPQLLAFGLSFSVIGLYWMAHWRRFGYITHTDERLVAINLVLLAFIALMPFPTSMISAFGNDPAAVLWYVGVISAAGLAATAGWWHARRAGLLVPGLPDRYLRLLMLRGLTVPIVMVASLPLLLVGDYLAELSWLLILPVSAIVSRRLRRVQVELQVPPPA